jgi:sentrin-specific protease 1
MKLNHLHAHQEYLSWERFKHLLKEKTCLRLPIDATKPDSKERAAYFELLAENGISATKEISLLGSEAAAAIDAGAVQPLAEEMRESHRRTHSQLQSALLAAGVGATSTEVQSLVDRVEARASGAVVDDELKNLLMDTEDSNADKGIDDSERIHKVLIPARYEEIPTEEETRFKRIAHGPETDEVIIEKFNIPMTKAKLACLKPSTWLNDEVINFYFNMLQVRDQSLCERDPSRKKSHFFNSFFMERLIITDGKYTYANVKRWSKKFDVFTLNKVYFPVNISNMHWTLAIVDIVNKEIHYYDSMSGSGGRFLNALQQWLVDEAKVKKGQTLDPNEYTLIDREPHVPQQKNGCDCGVFTTVAADFISDSLPLEYSQKDMPFFRNKMGTDIMRGHLKYPL